MGVFSGRGIGYAGSERSTGGTAYGTDCNVLWDILSYRKAFACRTQADTAVFYDTGGAVGAFWRVFRVFRGEFSVGKNSSGKGGFGKHYYSLFVFAFTVVAGEASKRGKGRSGILVFVSVYYDGGLSLQYAGNAAYLYVCWSDRLVRRSLLPKVEGACAYGAVLHDTGFSGSFVFCVGLA